jgi:hypothetical protein
MRNPKNLKIILKYPGGPVILKPIPGKPFSPGRPASPRSPYNEI